LLNDAISSSSCIICHPTTWMYMGENGKIIVLRLFQSTMNTVETWEKHDQFPDWMTDPVPSQRRDNDNNGGVVSCLCTLLGRRKFCLLFRVIKVVYTGCPALPQNTCWTLHAGLPKVRPTARCGLAFVLHFLFTELIWFIVW
jgi:hypothetical protein